MGFKYVGKIINFFLLILISLTLFSCASNNKQIIDTSNVIEDNNQGEENNQVEKNNPVKTYESIIKELFYVKNDIAYVVFDGNEYEISEVAADTKEIYNQDSIFYVANDDIFYAIFKDTKNNENKVYSIKNNKGNAEINLLIRPDSKYEKLEFLYKDQDRLYFSKFDFIPIGAKGVCIGSVIEVQNGKVNYLYNDIEINDKENDMLYYSKNIDTVFYISLNDNATTYTITSIWKGEYKIIYDDASLVVANSLRVIATVDGIYYNLPTKGGVAFYDGTEHLLIKDVYIREIRKTTSNNMFYFISITHKKININDYVDSSSYPNSVLRELDDVDTTKMNVITHDLYAVSGIDFKLIGQNISLSKIFIQDDYVFFYTLKNNFNRKIRYVEFNDSIKNNEYAKKRSFARKVESYFHGFLYKNTEFAYIYKGFEGTRLNFSETTLKGNAELLIDKGRVYYITSQTGELYVGDIVYNEVTNLKRATEGKNYYKVRKAAGKIFLDKQYAYDSNKSYDWCLYVNDIATEIGIDEKYELRVYDDLEDNIYIYSENNGIFLYDANNNDLELIIDADSDEIINLVYKINRNEGIHQEYIYNENNKENFYLTNPSEYLRILKEKDSNTEQIHENQNVDDAKIKAAKTINPNNLPPDYVGISEKNKFGSANKQDKSNKTFFYIWNEDKNCYELCANIEKDGKISKIHVADFEDTIIGDFEKPEYIYYDELNDVYYYESIKNIKGNSSELKYQIYEATIDKDNNLTINLKLDKTLPSKEFNDDYDGTWGIRYLGAFGKYDIYVTSSFNIYADDGKDFKPIGKVNNFSPKNIGSVFAISNRINKLYYLDRETLYEVDINLDKKVIDEHVSNFILSDNDVFFTTKFMNRYKYGRAERLFEVSRQVVLIGHQNSDRFYVLDKNYKSVSDKFKFNYENSDQEMVAAWENIKDKRMLYPYGGNSLSVYENGRFKTIVDQCKLIKDSDNEYEESIIDNPLLVATYENEEKLSFNDYYKNFDKNDKNNENNLLNDISKYAQETYIVYVDGSDLAFANVNKIFDKKSDYPTTEFVKNLKLEENIISFTKGTKMYSIDLSDGNVTIDESTRKSSKKKSAEYDSEVTLINMGY